MATVRPAFQRQGPSKNCVIAGKELGWDSCTAYAMAMLIDVATEGARRPKGCRIRRLVEPRDVDNGLNLRQVADVVLKEFGIRVSVRTGMNAVKTAKAVRQLRKGRGFILQGNNEAFDDKGTKDHAIWVNEVRGGTAAKPRKALVYDPQRRKETWIKWDTVLAFGAALHMNASGTKKLGSGRLYAAFPPPRPTPAQSRDLPAPVVEPDVLLRFGARRTRPFPDRTRANPPAGRRVNIRLRPDRLRKADIVDSLGAGEVFEARQRMANGARPAGSSSTVWFGNRDGTEWVHESGLRKTRGGT